jgi:hypothetical protein
LVAAVCARCGLIRSEVVAPRNEVWIDLSGGCAEDKEASEQT